MQAFFTPEYLEAHPEDAVLITKLQDLIASQIPLLDLCIQIHRQRAPPSLGPFQKRLEECFAEMQNHVESKYGKKVLHSIVFVRILVRRVLCYFSHFIMVRDKYSRLHMI